LFNYETRKGQVATAEGGNGQKGRGVTEWTCGMRRAEENDDGIMHGEGISKLVKGLPHIL
jgi:hypothetical protein